MRWRAERVDAASEMEAVRAVRRARAEGRKLRVAGSGGSKSGVDHAPDLLLRLRQPDRLLEISDGRVTAPGGMTTGRLQDLLRRPDLALPTVGEWREATLAGSLATGTHGGSARHGVLSTSVVGLRIVTGTGEIVELSAGDPDLEHAAVSLGAFGVLWSVTLACEARFALRLETDVVPFRDYLRDPVAQESRTEFHASVWMPEAGRVIRFAARRTPPPVRPIPREERFGRRTALANLAVRRLGLHGAVSYRGFRRTAVGDCAEILSPLEVPPRVARFRNFANGLRRRKATELAVPAERAGEALGRFGEVFLDHAGALNNPIGLRLTAADDLSLSPCSGRDTLWLDVFHDEDGAFEEALSGAAVELGARCHWGKALAVPVEALRATYPRWEAFREARRRFDPEEVFANSFTDRLGLTGRPTVAHRRGAHAR